MQSPKLSFFQQSGKTSYWPDARPVQSDTLFDIGSLTKVVATTSILARLFDRKELSLDERVSDTVIELKQTALKDAKIKDLLTHTAGLKAWLPLYLNPTHWHYSEWAQENKTGPVYSDLGFLLIKIYLEKRFGGISELFEREVMLPLKLKSTIFTPDPKNHNIVATEYCLHRKRLLQGEVFDENTWALGGVSTQAGLFSTAMDLQVWATAWLTSRQKGTEWLSKNTAKTFTEKLEGSRALGFDTKSSQSSSLGAAFSLSTFGHLGYPGTSVWIDPEVETSIIFLTNRIHPSRLDERLKKIRPELHEKVFQVLKEEGAILG